MKDEANLAPPDQSNEAERAEGVKRANLPDPYDYEEKLAAMSACEALEFGLNEIHEASCPLYIRYKCSQAMVDAFIGDEYFGADRSVVLKERMGSAVKTDQKLSVAAKAAVGINGGPFSGKGSKNSKGGR